MRIRKYALMLLGLSMCLCSGCFLLEMSDPPFDASGSFTGTWTSDLGAADGDLKSCAMQVEIAQDMGALRPVNYALEGRVQINFTCAEVLAVLEDLRLPAAIDVDFLGAMTESGDLLIGSVDLAGNRDELVLVEARGYDRDEDGFMEELNGAFTMLVEDSRGRQTTVSASFELWLD